VIDPLVAAELVTAPVPKTEGLPLLPEVPPDPNEPTVTVYEVPAAVT
jgi:hypothetical protein